MREKETRLGNIRQEVRGLEFPGWREINIPPHAGGEDLMNRIRGSGMHVERWAEGLFRAATIEPRTSPIKRHMGRISNQQLGLVSPTVPIIETKKAGRSQGLQFLTREDILALRLSYTDQPPEWMRVAMDTYVDEDGSWLDLAIVNDGVRRDIRTTWAFEQNLYQPRHEWFWVLPE